VSAASEVPTRPIPVRAADRIGGGARRSVASAIALMCLAMTLLEATADVLPDDTVLPFLTPLRLVLAAGMAAAAVAGVRPRAWLTPLDGALAALLLAAALATVVAGQPWAAWRGLLAAAAAYYLVVGVRRALPDSGPALGMLALVAVAVAGATAARQAAGGIPTGFCRGALDGSADVCGPDALVRAVGTFSNPNLLAAFLVLLLPVAAAGAAALTDRHARLAAAAVVALGYAAVLLTGSRGGIIAAVAGMAAFALVRARGPRLRIALAAAAVATAAAVLIAAGLSFGVRADVWTAAVRLVVDNPLGVGPGRAGALLDAAVPGEEAFQHAHNLWLNWAVEAGLPGLAAALTVTVVSAVIGVRSARTGSLLGAGATAGLAGFAVMSLADHPAAASRIAVALCAVLAIVATEARPRQNRSAADRRPVEVGLEVDDPRHRHALTDPRLGRVDGGGDGLKWLAGR
jgi:O-Antigen ligase